MTLRPVVFALLALSTVAYATDPVAPTAPAGATNRIVATKVDGVTIEQIRDAKAPIPVAKFDADNGKRGLRCYGPGGELSCEVWNLDTNQMIAASTDLKICKSGNDFAIMGEKVGPNRLIIIPQGQHIGDPSKRLVCGG